MGSKGERGADGPKYGEEAGHGAIGRSESEGRIFLRGGGDTTTAAATPTLCVKSSAGGAFRPCHRGRTGGGGNSTLGDPRLFVG